MWCLYGSMSSWGSNKEIELGGILMREVNVVIDGKGYGARRIFYNPGS